MSIESQISKWDKKSADDIRAINQNYYKDSEFSNTLISMLKDTLLQVGASWLLKAYLESKYPLSQEQIKAIYSSLNLLEPWEAKLHILQCMPYMPIDKDSKNNVTVFLRLTLTDLNKFVRAWSYNGFYELARQYPDHREETEQFFEMAMRDEAASVKARIRQIMKKGF